MIMTTPPTIKAYVLRGLILYLLIPVIVAINTYINYKLKLYNPNADIIAIPIFQSMFTMVVLTPIFSLYLYIGGRKYKGNMNIWSWKKNKSYYFGLAMTIVPALFSGIVIIGSALSLHILIFIHWVFIFHFILMTRVAISEKNIA